MDEPLGRIEVVRKEASQASRGCDQPISSPEEAEELISIVVQDEATSGLTSRREALFNSLMNADIKASQSETPYTQIHKVPTMLLETHDSKYNFEPIMVSIGPYHHGKDKLNPAEMLKLNFSKQFLNSCHQQKEVAHDKIFKDIKKLRDCYDEDPTKKYDDEALAWMLFVDGCFILHFVHCLVQNQYTGLNIKIHELVFLIHDLFLLENQLPFQVLENLMSSRFQDDEEKQMIKKFVKMNFQLTHSLQEPQVAKEKPAHLLDLLRGELVGKSKRTDNQQCPWNVIKLLLTWLHPHLPRRTKDKISRKGYTFRNVTELKAVGIHLKASDTNCVTDFSFKSHFFSAELKLPRITVDDSTRATFLNLIAYEMCRCTVSSDSSDLEVTSYVCFIDSLIDHPNDVKMLREKHILRNCLGSDDEVARLFNEISNGLVPDGRAYEDVKASIQKHVDNKCNTWIAKAFHDHFSTPWSIVAFFAAFLVIMLSLIQTYYTISPGSQHDHGKH